MSDITTTRLVRVNIMLNGHTLSRFVLGIFLDLQQLENAPTTSKKARYVQDSG